MKTIITVLFGAFFGFVLIEAQAISWYRIQEMFYFKSFHMFGLLGSAIFTGALSLFLIKKFHIKSWYKNDIKPIQKPLTWKANFFGGIIFGLGWAFTGVCSAPLFILIGVKWNLGLILLFGALIGTYFYAKVKDKIPH